MPHYLWLASLYARVSPATWMGKELHLVEVEGRMLSEGDEDWLIGRARHVVFTR
jgi:hypothetical protein